MRLRSLLCENQRIADAKGFAGFGGGDARGGGEAVEMLEAVGVRPGRELRAALLNETFLKADDVGAGVGIARGDGAADAWIAAFNGDFADVEADYATKFRAEEVVFPECWHAVELQSCTEAQTGFGDGHSGKPFADGLERGGGDDSGAVGNEIVGDAGGIVADHDWITQVSAEPFGGWGGVGWESECRWKNIFRIVRNGKAHACEAGLVGGADEVEMGDAGGSEEAAV